MNKENSTIFFDKIRNLIKLIIPKLADILNIDLLIIAYRKIGILNSGTLKKTGELYVIENVLPKLLPPEPIIFDIGANDGENALVFRDHFSEAKIYAFEPNNAVYEKLQKRTKDKNIMCVNIGLGDKNQTAYLNFYSKIKNSGVGTYLPGALTGIYKDTIGDKVISNKTSILTLDSFCQSNKVINIDFLKIDVEGYEFNVLKGAKKLLSRRKIKIIQFEFNEFNVYSRVFIKDFFELLPNFDFFRIKKEGLVPMKEYKTDFEIFKFQNILAINKSINANSL